MALLEEVEVEEEGEVVEEWAEVVEELLKAHVKCGRGINAVSCDEREDGLLFVKGRKWGSLPRSVEFTF